MNYTAAPEELATSEPLGMMMMMMYMSFYNTNDLVLLFKQIDSKADNSKYAGLLAIVACLVLMMEALSFMRFKSVYQINNLTQGEFTFTQKLALTGNYMLSVTLAYAIMLCIMSFNAGVFITVIVSLTACHAGFGYYKHTYYTFKQ